MKNFEGFGLSPALNKSLAYMKYTAPTPIQEKAIPLALEGRDILGSAQTGTGKTAAFSIPLIESLLRSPQGSAMVLTPTRELAKQVLDVIHQLLGPQSKIKTAFIIGGDPMGKQLNQLRNNPRIIVGTPGRINDHLERGTMELSDTGFLVLDETDRMLDMGFGVQLDKILKFLPEQRQTLMFSATLPKGIINLSGKYMNNPERVSVGATNVVAVNIEQEIIRIEQDKKYEELVSQLHDRSGSVIVFAKTKHGSDRMAKNLRRDGFTSEALHGDLRQNKRDKVMKNFRNQNFRILVATDIAARGLDVPHIEHVINYDLPQVAEDYIHRMGRTARGGATGSAVCFISPQDGRKWHAIEMLLDPDKKREASNDRKRKRPSRSNGKKKFAKPSGEKRKFDKPRDENRKPSDRPSGGKKSEGKKFDGKKFEGKRPEGKKFDDKKADGKKFDGKKSGAKTFDAKKPKNKKPAGKKFDGSQAIKKKRSGNKPQRKAA